MAKIKICETVLRDSHQSLIATRMTTEEMLPILEKMDQVGYYSLEAWGGATFDSCLRFLNEDPWERLRKIRDKVKNTKLQMLFRGQNILGYRHYADDVVENFVRKSIANGIDIIRIFDALNDPRNLKTAINATKAARTENTCSTALWAWTEKTTAASAIIPTPSKRLRRNTWSQWLRLLSGGKNGSARMRGITGCIAASGSASIRCGGLSSGH